MAVIYNAGPVPLVVAWGEGVIDPGGSFETDTPDGFPFPWTTDENEARQAALAWEAAGTVTSSPARRGRARQDAQAPTGTVGETQPPTADSQEQNHDDEKE